MTLNSTIIADAYRESNFTAQGGVLTADEQSEGLTLLQGLVDSFFGTVVGTRPKPWFIPRPNNTAPEAEAFPADSRPAEYAHRKDAYPPANSRVILRTTAAQTIYFQMMPQDGAMMQIVDAGFTADVTLDANGVFLGASGTATSDVLTTAVAGGSRVPTRTYVFRGDIASWVQIEDLIYAQELPFPPEFKDFFVTYLAMRLAPRYGNEPSQVTMLRAKDMLVFCRNWYHQSSESMGTGSPSSEQSFASPNDWSSEYGGGFS
jgi:hypothetical protein